MDEFSSALENVSNQTCFRLQVRAYRGSWEKKTKVMSVMRWRLSNRMSHVVVVVRWREDGAMSWG